MTPLVEALSPIIGSIFNSLFQDPQKKAEAESKLVELLLDHQEELEKAASSIIQTEAASQHWLAANWRPIVMLVFCGLVVAQWFGFIAPNISEEQYNRLWSTIETGIGGYMVVSSIERIAPSLMKIVKR